MCNLPPTTYNLPKKGFTLVEALVAITILLIAIVGPLSIVAQSVQTANLAKDQVTAFYLAQEAIEYIRNKRDTNYISSAVGWLTGSNFTNCTGVNTCSLDVVADTTSICAGGASACPKLNRFKDIATNRITYSPSTAGTYVPTTFVRSVNITQPVSSVALITVTINWQTGTVPRSFKIIERIYDWI